MTRTRAVRSAWIAGTAALALILTACGSSSDSGSSASVTVGGGAAATAGGDASGTIEYWLWDANQLPAYQDCADRVQQEIPERQGQHHPVRLGRLLGQDQQRFHLRHRPGRVHRPPVQVPGVREQAIHPQPVRCAQGRRRGQGHLPARPAEPVDRPGRRHLRPAEGLRHGRPVLQRGHGHRGRLHRRGPADPDLEPHRRRHVREVHRAHDHRQQRCPR